MGRLRGPLPQSVVFLVLFNNSGRTFEPLVNSHLLVLLGFYPRSPHLYFLFISFYTCSHEDYGANPCEYLQNCNRYMSQLQFVLLDPSFYPKVDYQIPGSTVSVMYFPRSSSSVHN